MKYLILLSLAVISFSSCKDKDDEIIEPVVTLTNQEKSDLQFLREEEKLARDVYLHSHTTYNQQIFSNISSSEQRHMDEVLTLLNTYGIADPISNNEPGIFENQELQNLYNELTKISDSSVVHAYTIGATIEDLDIHDISKFESNTDNPTILSVYQKLACGSRNHMRAFHKSLTTEGASYTAQYITPSDLEEILNGEHENCGQ